MVSETDSCRHHHLALSSATLIILYVKGPSLCGPQAMPLFSLLCTCTPLWSLLLPVSQTDLSSVSSSFSLLFPRKTFTHPLRHTPESYFPIETFFESCKQNRFPLFWATSVPSSAPIMYSYHPILITDFPVPLSHHSCTPSQVTSLHLTL